MADSGLTGDWAGLERKLAEIGSKFKTEVQIATDQNGLILQKAIKGRIEGQKGFKPLSQKYLERKIFGSLTKRYKAKLAKTPGMRRKIMDAISHGEDVSSITSKGMAKQINRGLSEMILVATGTLLKNIHYQKIDWKAGFVGVNRHEPKKGYDLGWIHEYGSRDGRVPARPYIEPGISEVADQIIKRYEDAIDRVFK